MSIPKFEDTVLTQWFHDDQSFVHELTVRFNAGFRQMFPSRLTGEVCERAQHECVEQLRRNVHECAAGKCEMEYVSDFMSWHCKACDMMDMAPRNPKPRFCKWCGRKVVDA